MRDWSPPLLILLRSLVLWHELCCLPKSVSLLSDDSVLAILCSSSCLCIGHTEHVISNYSSVNSTVAWNGVSVFGSLVPWLFNSVEYFQGVLLWLTLHLRFLSGTTLDIEEGSLVLLELLILNDFIPLAGWYSEEVVDCLGWNRLLQMLIFKSITFLYES